MSNDHSDFLYDQSVRDSSNEVMVDVTLVTSDSDILLSLKSGSLNIPFFLKPHYARILGKRLIAACEAYDKAVAAAKSAETASE